MKLKAKSIIFSALLGCMLAGNAQADDGAKYVVAKKENDKWVLVSTGATLPTYQEGQEILSLPWLEPVFDSRFKMVRSVYGGYNCPVSPDKTMYTPCTSGLYRFIGANFFGLGGIRVDQSDDRVKELQQALFAQSATIAGNYNKAVADVKAQDLARQKAATEREAQAVADHKKLLVTNLQKMAKLDRGMEDQCARQIDYRLVGLGTVAISAPDPKNEEITCTFGGVVMLGDLPSAGWLVTNKSRDKDGIVTEYTIRKAR